MTPKHIFCQCMKPWKLCVSKQNSYKLDVRYLIDIYRLRTPFLSDPKDSSCYDVSYNINYDFINMRPSDTKFACRFSDNSTKKL